MATTGSSGLGTAGGAAGPGPAPGCNDDDEDDPLVIAAVDNSNPLRGSGGGINDGAGQKRLEYLDTAAQLAIDAAALPHDDPDLRARHDAHTLTVGADWWRTAFGVDCDDDEKALAEAAAAAAAAAATVGGAAAAAPVVRAPLQHPQLTRALRAAAARRLIRAAQLGPLLNAQFEAVSDDIEDVPPQLQCDTLLTWSARHNSAAVQALLDLSPAAAIGHDAGAGANAAKPDGANDRRHAVAVDTNAVGGGGGGACAVYWMFARRTRPRDLSSHLTTALALLARTRNAALRCGRGAHADPPANPQPDDARVRANALLSPPTVLHAAIAAFGRWTPLRSPSDRAMALSPWRALFDALLAPDRACDDGSGGVCVLACDSAGHTPLRTLRGVRQTLSEVSHPSVCVLVPWLHEHVQPALAHRTACAAAYATDLPAALAAALVPHPLRAVRALHAVISAQARRMGRYALVLDALSVACVCMVMFAAEPPHATATRTPPQLPQACEPPFDTYPFCDVHQSVPARVADLLARLNLTDKIAQTQNTAPAIASLGIPSYQWWSESLHGVNSHCSPTPSGRCPTSFPAALGLAAAFNEDLWGRVATAISDEARALRSVLTTEFLGDLFGLDVWAPNINIFRDPRWGRGQETPGEDPVLSGRYGAAYVRGLQNGDDARYLKLAATLKHFDAYSLEDSDGVQRYGFDAVVSAQDLAQTYLPAFETAVRKGGAAGVMCAYNAINGVPACAHTQLLTDTLRDAWGFDGYVTSDCDAIANIFQPHNYTQSSAAAVAVAVRAGCDLDCGSTYPSFMQQAIDRGLMTEADLDVILTRLFTLRMRLGLFDPLRDQPYNQIPVSVVDSPAHRALARQAARESIVLLKNDNQLLPLSVPGATVALIGPNANATDVLCSNYYGSLPHVVSVLEGLTNAQLPQGGGLNVVYEPGLMAVNSTDRSGFAAAQAAARAADVAVLVLGLDQTVESEGHDRVTIDLPGAQLALLQAVMEVQPNTILVLVNGGAVDLSWPAQHVPAIVEAFYPGVEGGHAVADILVGVYNPSARLPYTVYAADFVKSVPMTSMSLREAQGKTYRFFTGTPVYPFGSGLSYTTWSFALTGPAPGATLTDPTTYHVTVTNTGSTDGDLSVLGFVGKLANADDDVDVDLVDASAYVDTDCPLRQLFDFQKTSLRVGASHTLSFTVAPSSAGCVDTTGRAVVKAGTYQLTLGDATTTFVILSSSRATA